MKVIATKAHKNDRKRIDPIVVRPFGNGGCSGRVGYATKFRLNSTMLLNVSPLQATPPNFSQAEFRAALGMFATGVTIVTARTEQGVLVGLTANSFNSVSLSPPLVLWSLSRAAGSMAAFRTGSHYAVNILSADQQDLAKQFASRDGDRFANVQYELGPSGAPLLEGAIATFECYNRSRYEEGDHVIFVGEVERCAFRAGVPPLLFHGGKFYAEHPL